MAVIRYVRSIGSVSWIDSITGLAEVDRIPPGATASRSYLTGSSGFRFVNFLEVWTDYDTEGGTIIGHGFTNASGIYRALSFGGIPSQVFNYLRKVQVGQEPITFSQIIGARTQSPEKIGGMFGPGGNIFASAVAALPPIWTELELKIYNDGRAEGRVLRHSLFPSMTFFTADVDSAGTPVGTYTRSPVPVISATYYNGVPSLDRWKKSGWGAMRGSTPGPTAGNPWNMEETVLSGIDPSQPFGW